MKIFKRKSKYSFGITLAFFEVILTILIASLVKVIADDLSVFVILFYRYLFCIPIILITAFYQRKKNTFKIESKIGLCLRTIAGLFSFGFLFAALRYLDLSLMTTLFNTIPLFITILAPLLINEKVGRYRLIMAFIGFIGVFLTINPNLEVIKFNDYGIIFGILCPFFASLMLISLRNLGKTDHPTSTALWYNIFGAMVFFIVCILDKGQIFGLNDLYIVLISIGVLSSLQQVCLSYSHKLVPVSLLAPLRYISVPIGILVGVTYFGEKVQPLFYLGAFVIGVACISILVRENNNN